MSPGPSASRARRSTSKGSLSPIVNGVETENTDRETHRPGLFDRYVGVFVSPDTLFQGLRRRPDWAGALLLGSCLVLAGTFLIPPDLTIATLRERMLEQGQPFPPGLADRMGAIRIGGSV